MDKVQFKERWNNIFNSSSSNGLIAKLLYKKPLESNETRLERHSKQQKQSRARIKEEQQERNRQSAHKYFQANKDKEEYKALKRDYQKRYYDKHKDEVAFKEKRRQYQREYYAKDPNKKIRRQKKYYQEHKDYYRAYYQRKRQEKLLLENDEPKRATEELARFTQEERRQYDLWEIEWNKKFKETQKHTVY